MSKGVIDAIAGGIMIAGGILLMTLPGGQLAGIEAIIAGAGLVLVGVGTMLSSGPLSGTETTVRNPIAPWQVRYGQSRVGGTMIFCNSFGTNDKWLDMVMVLAAHPCQQVDALLLNMQRVRMTSHVGTPNGWQDYSYGSEWEGGNNENWQVGMNIPSTNDITRTNNVVKIHLPQEIENIQVNDKVTVSAVHPVNALINGQWPLYGVEYPSTGGQDLYYLSGGPQIPSEVQISESGHIQTAYPDYHANVYMEVMLGTQTLGETFVGMTQGTPYDGEWGNWVQNENQPWNVNCSAVGKTVVFLRLHYDSAIFSQGLPTFSFILSGKNNIYDPRSSSSGYTTNPALCIADYLADTTYGYKVNYNSDIPSAELITAANICDESITLVSGDTEPRYTMNGGFTLTMKRSEILQNMLTSIAGRLSYLSGNYYIWPGAWAGISGNITGTQIYSESTNSIVWRPKVPINSLYNAVKGTYIATINNWMSSDFPPYAQDDLHGYNNGDPQYFYDANLTNDQGDRRYLDVQLPFTITSPMAQRIAKIELMRRRYQGTGTFTLNMSGYLYSPLDVLAVDLPYFGWTAQYLEVLACRLRIEAQAEGGASMWTELDVQETDSSVYYFDEEAEELSPQGYQQAIVPDLFTPAPPTDFTGTSANGNIYLNWTAPADAFVTSGGHIEIQYREVTSPEGLWYSLAKMDPSVTTAVIENLPIGSTYEAQIRSVNVGGVPSAWVPAETLTSPPTTGIIIEPPVLWDPGYDPGDAFFGPSFGIAQLYPPGENGAPLSTLDIYGDPPSDPTLTLLVKVRREFVSGIWAQELAYATPVSPPDGIHGVLFFGIGSIPAVANQFVGRIISKLAKPFGNTDTVPIQDFTVIGNDAIGNFTVTPDPSTMGALPGDLYTMRTAPTSATTDGFTDDLFNNCYGPGLIPSGNRGNLVLILYGTGAGQPAQTIIDNTATSATVSPGWATPPDATSFIAIVEAVPQVSLPVNNTSVNDQLLGGVPVLNYAGQAVRVEAYTSSGVYGPIESVPFRETYIWGAQGSRIILSSDPDAMVTTDFVVRFDTSGVTQPPTDNIAGDIDASTTSLSFSEGVNIVNGTIIQIDSEQLYVQSGTAPAFTCARGWNGTAAAAHTSGATVTVPGARIWHIIPFDLVPNQEFLFDKISTDINFVKLVPQGTDILPDNEPYHILADTSSAYGTYGIKVPAL